MPHAGDQLDLDVVQPVAGGRMLARHEGQVVLVSGAIPGERVTAVVERVTRQMIWARTVDVPEPSPDRRAPICDPACGGSSYAHVAYERQRALKAAIIADAFRRIAKVTLDASPAVAASPESAYRLRARLHVRQRRAGFFREGPHDLCDATDTGQLHPHAAAATASTMSALGARAAECESLIVAETVAGSERVVHLVPHPGARLDDLGTTLNAVPHATGITTFARGRMVTLAGTPTITETVSPPGPSLSRHAPSFFQGNRFLVGALASRVVDLARGERVVDLYSGVGLFALGIAARGAEVLAVEGDEMSGADLVRNAEALTATVDVLRAPVEDALQEAPATRPDTIVVDPPRTGLSPAALEGVLRWEAARVVYVSCDPPTLARDAKMLLAGGCQLTSLEAFDFFPNTPHVETLAVFDQRTR
jgi:23S rRNA (uracil1939-C5)-methyltransferase